MIFRVSDPSSNMIFRVSDPSRVQRPGGGGQLEEVLRPVPRAPTGTLSGPLRGLTTATHGECVQIAELEFPVPLRERLAVLYRV